MKTDPAQFFMTKIAKDDPTKVIDPGEAAAAATALTSGVIAQKILPTAANIALINTLGIPPESYQGLMPRLGAKEFTMAKGQSTHTGELLNLFNISAPFPSSQELEQLRATDPKAFENLKGNVMKQQKYMEKIKPTIDSMMDRYDLKRKGVKFDIHSGAMARLRGPYYTPSTKTITMPFVNEDYVLHELGHAAHLTKPGAQTFNTMRRFVKKGLNYAYPMAYLVGNEIQKMVPGKIDDKIISFVQDHSPAIFAGSVLAADVYPEVQATARSVHHVYKTKGAKAAKSALKRWLPHLGTYLIPAIPTMVGLAVARKYFKSAKEKQEKQEKTASFITDARNLGSGLWAQFGRPLAQTATEVSGQVSKQVQELASFEPRDIAKIVWEAQKKNIKSPEFVAGALTAGIPATTLAIVANDTKYGRMLEEKWRQRDSKAGPLAQAYADVKRLEAKKREGSITYPAIVGITAALSGGMLAKFFTDLGRVL